MKYFPKEEYEWNETNVDIILKNPKENKMVIVKQTTGFFRKLGIKGLNVGNITRIIDTGYDNIKKIINASIEDLMKVEGFKSKMANNIYNNIHSVIDNPIKLEILMSASNKFGRGFGCKRFKQIVDIYPDILTTQYSEIDICEIDGFSTKTSKRFMERLPAFKNFLDKNNFIIDKITGNDPENINSEQNDKYSELFKDKRVIFTGFRDKELEKLILDNGGKLTNVVNSKTSFVVRKSKKNNSSKVKKANEMGIPVFILDEFITTNSILYTPVISSTS